jgi:hypothetical protein
MIAPADKIFKTWDCFFAALTAMTAIDAVRAFMPAKLKT